MCTHASSAKNQTEIFNILYRVYRTVQYYCCHCCPLKVGKWSIYYQDLFLIGSISQSKSPRKPSPVPSLHPTPSPHQQFNNRVHQQSDSSPPECFPMHNNSTTPTTQHVDPARRSNPKQSNNQCIGSVNNLDPTVWSTNWTLMHFNNCTTLRHPPHRSRPPRHLHLHLPCHLRRTSQQPHPLHPPHLPHLPHPPPHPPTVPFNTICKTLPEACFNRPNTM